MSKPWPTVRLGEVLKEHDSSVPVSQLNEVNLAGVYSFARGLFKRGPMLPGDTSYKSYNRLVADDFVISVPKAWEGALARVTPEFEGWFLSPVFPTFRANRERLEPRFLEWFCKRVSVWTQLQGKSRGIGARRESVHPDQFLSLEIPLPPLAEQRRVVARIEELAAQIHEARTLRHQATEETSVLVTRSTEKVFAEACVSFASEPLGTHVKLQGGYAFKSDEYLETGLPIVRIANLENETVHTSGSPCMPEDRLGEFNRFVLNPGDILVAMTGATTGKLGIVPENCGTWLLNQRVGRFLPKKPDELEPKYVYWLARGVQKHILETAYGGAQPNISPNDIEAMKFPFPPLAEQRRIVAELDALQAEVDALKRLQAETATELDAMLPAILDRAFKGEL